MQKRNLLKSLWIIFIGLVLTAGSSALATVQPSTTTAGEAGLGEKVVIGKKPIQIVNLGIDPIDKMKPQGKYVIHVLNGGKWEEAGGLTYDRFLRERELDLSKLPRSSGEIKVKLIQKGGGAAHIDAVSLGGMPPSKVTGSQEPLGLKKLAKCDYDMLDAFGETLEFTFPNNGTDKTLKLTARVEPKTVSEIPFQFPTKNLFKEINEKAHFYTYQLRSQKTNSTSDTKLTEIERPFFKEYCRTGSGHPHGFTYGWVENDDKNLYVKIDFTPDNTMDGDKDYAKVYVKTSSGLKAFRAAEHETKWGNPEFIYNDKAAYQHKVYNFSIPLKELNVKEAESRLLLAFSAYGTAYPSGSHLNPAIAHDPATDLYLIVYEQTLDMGGGTNLHGRVINAYGSELTPDFQFLHSPVGNYNPVVEYDSANQLFLVVWEHYEGIGGESDIYGIPIRVDASGIVSLGSQFIVNCDRTGYGDQINPAIEYDSVNGKFLVVWEDNRTSGTTGWDIYGQTVQGCSFPGPPCATRCIGTGELDKIISDSSYDQTNPSVAFDSNEEEFLVVWEDYDDHTEVSQNFYPWILGQYLDANGDPIYGGNFPVSDVPYVTGNPGEQVDSEQHHPVAGYDSANGKFLVVWEDDRNSGSTGTDIYGQRLEKYSCSVSPCLIPLIPSQKIAGGDIAGDSTIILALADDFAVSELDQSEYPSSMVYDQLSQGFLVVWSYFAYDMGYYFIFGRVVFANATFSSPTLSLRDTIASWTSEAFRIYDPAVAYNGNQQNFMSAYEWMVSLAPLSPRGVGYVLFSLDADGDGMDDDWEVANFGDLSHDGTADGDGDSLTDLEEFQNNTDPNDPDSDGDGFSDGDEVAAGTDPNSPGTYSVGFTVFMNSDFTETGSVAGFSWNPISVVTLEIDKGADGSVEYTQAKGLDPDGVVRWFSTDGLPVVSEGDLVRMYDDQASQTVKQHYVKYVILTEVNPTTDTLTGSAREGAEVFVRVFDPALPFPDGPDLSDIAGPTEIWSVDFSGVFDIVSGNEGWVMVNDTDGDHTQINWRVPEMSVSGFIHHVMEPGQIPKTYVEVIIGNEFLGSLPGDTTITVRRPNGSVLTTYPGAEWQYLPQYRDFWAVIDGPPPELGVYTFDVTSAGLAGSDTDFQYVIRNIPNPDTNTFMPAEGAELTSKTPSFSWGPVDFADNVPIYYRLEINDGADRVYASDRVLGMTSHTVPLGILQAGQPYTWRVRAVDASDFNLLQNRSHSEWLGFTMATILTHSAPPAIDLRGWGVLSWTWDIGSTGTECWVRIYDHDGISSDGSSHSVTVTFPDATQHDMYFVSSYGSTCAGYEFWDDISPPSGTYTFRVTDPDWNVATLTETLDPSDINPLAPPVENSITPNLLTEHITASFDNVYINGNLTTAFEDFNSYSSINDIDWSKWSWHENASIDNANGWLFLDIGNSVGRANGSLGFADPTSINEIIADITIKSTSSDAPRAEIAGTWCHNGVGDIFAKITVTSNRIYYSVDQQYINEQGTYQWDSLESVDLLNGSFVNVPVTAEISWDDATSTLTFTATGAPSRSYFVSGNLGPPVFDSAKMLRTRINLITDTTPTFTWDPVPYANRYRLKIYNYDINNRREIWRDTFGEQTDYTVPPGILNPGSYYRFRLEAWDAHSPLNVDNISNTPASNDYNYRFYTGDQEDDVPFIDLHDHGVYVWYNASGSNLQFVIKVHDAQGVPGNIKYVKVIHPNLQEEYLDFYGDNPFIASTPTSALYELESIFLPVHGGTYTFVVEDNDDNFFHITEVLTVDPIGVPALASLSPAEGTEIAGTAVTFNWDSVADAAFYAIDIFDYDFNRVHQFFTTSHSYNLPAGFLKENTLYRWRVKPTKEFFSQNVDNNSSSPGNYLQSLTFTTAADTDGDGMPDWWEILHFGDISRDGTGDLDGDGLIDMLEYTLGSDPDSFNDINRDGESDFTDDSDGDLIPDYIDNCPFTFTADQSQDDMDNDGYGDACDDSDGDGVMDAVDPCPYDYYNDADEDGFCADVDNCPDHKNPIVDEWTDKYDVIHYLSQPDFDGDGDGDACDEITPISGEKPSCLPNQEDCNTIDDVDKDGLADSAEQPCDSVDCTNYPDCDYDGVSDGSIDPDDSGPIIAGPDNCLCVANTDQTDTDGDLEGDACDPDDDNDQVSDDSTDPDGSGPIIAGPDNCPLNANNDQTDNDQDGIGDACDPDIDGDGLTKDQETALGTDPNDPDTDNDDWCDGPGVDDTCNGIPNLDDEDPLTPLGEEPKPTIVFETRETIAGPNNLDWWLPEDGNSVIVVAKLKDPSGAFIIPFESDVTFNLTPSAWSGVAFNDDREVCDPDCSNDYSFNASDPADLSPVTVAGGNLEAIVTIHSFDFGGQATMTATTTAGGETITGTITLPLDSDGDLVPNKIEEDYAVEGFDKNNKNSFDSSLDDGSMDIDTSLDNPFNEDGITNFREFRGVLKDKLTKDASGKVISIDLMADHIRLNPTRKDLFVRGDGYSNSTECGPEGATPKPLYCGDTDVLPFNIGPLEGETDFQNAFEEVKIEVHDVTGMPSFSGATEPPFLDILVVTNNTTQTATIRKPFADGYIDKTVNSVRQYSWDEKGAAYLNADSVLYSHHPIDTSQGGTFTYHLNLMHYVYNRPYFNCTSENANADDVPNTGDYEKVLDPKDMVEDSINENGVLDFATQPKSNEDKDKDQKFKGDRMKSDWKTLQWGLAPTRPGIDPYRIGYHFSTFDANGNGLVELPVVSDSMAITSVQESSAHKVQRHTILHEMGHAVGSMNPEHSSDDKCVMYFDSPNWDRPDHFGIDPRKQIMIHNKNE
jgi:hypothetical protein